MLNAVFPFVVRLRAASFAPVEWVTVPLLVRSMTTLVDAVGTTPPTQLPGVSQSPPVGAVVVFQMIVVWGVDRQRLARVGGSDEIDGPIVDGLDRVSAD